jgi:DNA-binding YbaB/EbfC family protein
MTQPPLGFAALLQQARELQERFARVREELAHREVSASAGGGLVRATANGQGRIVRIEIDPQLLGDRPMLEDLTRAAVNEALGRVQELVQGEVQRAAGPLGGLLGGWLSRP